MSRDALVVLAVVALAAPRRADACKTPPPCEDLAALSTLDGIVAKLDASDGEIAARAALTLARSSKPDQLKAVGRALKRPGVLARIMTVDQAKRCVMQQILRALASNPAPQARTEFGTLISAKTAERDSSDGADLPDQLLLATGVVRPVTADVTKMWSRFAEPDDGWVNVTVIALTENGTPQAVALFEQLLRDPRHELDTRIAWLHSDLVAHRDGGELLAMVDRLLGDTRLPAGLQIALIESVFDFQQQWYGTCPGPTLVPLAQYTPEARGKLRAIAAKARRRQLDKGLAAAVAGVVAELDRLDKARSP